MLSPIEFAGLNPQQRRAKDIVRRINVVSDQSRQDEDTGYTTGTDVTTAGHPREDRGRRRPPFHRMSA